MGSPQREILCKVLVVGDLGVGKTSIIQCYVHNVFSQCYRATIGVDFALKIVSWDLDTVERFGHMTQLYYREAMGAVVICVLGRVATVESVSCWKEDLDSKVCLQNGNPIPIVLLGNKCDQVPLGTSVSNLEQLCQELGFSHSHVTSVKENLNIEMAISSLIIEIFANDEDSETTHDPTIIQPSLHPSLNKTCSQCSRL